MSYLAIGRVLAIKAGMKNTHLLPLLWILILFCPAEGQARSQKPANNVNEQYTVESVELSGAAVSRIGKSLQEDMQKLVGEKYNQRTADELAKRLRRELVEYSVTVRVRRGDKPKHVKVVFVADRVRWKRFVVAIPPVVYHSKEGFSGAIGTTISSHHNVFTFGLVNSADELLERNAGFRVRYENRKVGTDIVQLRIDFDSYHQKWNPATEAALAQTPGVPGIYRTRQNFAPSLSLLPFRDLKLSVGISFQRFQTQYPQTHNQTAYAGTADIQYRRILQIQGGFRHDISTSYSLRSATRTLDSDFIYTRHVWTAGYTASKGRNLFGARFQGGTITGVAPLFERFSAGNSTMLRGWNKFDVAPLGDVRLAHGSLEYRYRPFQIFYDVGAVWNPAKPAVARHGLGFGLAFRNGAFTSLAFPVRLHNVVPVFMMGFRY
jgi:hypothetical protein